MLGRVARIRGRWRAGDGTALPGGLVGGLILGVPVWGPPRGQPLEFLVAVLAPLDVAREFGFILRIELLAQETVELLCVRTGIPHHRCVSK